MQEVSIFCKSIFKYKVTYPMQTYSKFVCNNISFFVICILMGKGLNNLGEFYYIFVFINHVMFSARQTRLLPVY